MILTPHQQLLLDGAQSAHLARIRAEKTEYEIARKLADERIAHRAYQEDMHIRYAIDNGVPKDRVRTFLKIGHSTLNDSLTRTENTQ
jgi:hypothetical protein